MADFNVNLAAPQASGANPVAPVQSPGFGGLIKDVVDIGAIFFDKKRDEEKQRKEEEKQRILSDFAREQTSLNDAMAQGAISKEAAAARARANASKYIANFTPYAKELSDINKNLFEHTDLGEAKEQEQSFQDQRKTLLADMQKSGITILPSMSVATQDTMIAAYQEQRRLDSDMERQIRINQELRSANAEERASYEAETKRKAAKGLVTIAASNLTTAYSFGGDLITKARAGGDPALLKQESMRYFSNIEGAINAVAAENPELASPWKQMFNDIRKTVDLGIDGKEASEVLERQLRDIKNKAQLMAMSDPKMQGAYAVSALIPGVPSIFPELNVVARDTVFRISSGGASRNLSIVGDKESENLSSSLITENVKMLKTGTHDQPEEAKIQLGNLANNILKGVDRLSLDGDAGHKDLNTVSALLASPEWAYMVENNIVNKELNNKAKQAFQILYNKDVSTGVVDVLKKDITIANNQGQAQTVPISKLIDVQWNGSGVAFVDKPQYKSAYDRGSSPQNKDLNTAGVVLNKLIRIGAHMEGHTDYAKYWETNKHMLLPGLYVPLGTKHNGYEYVGPGFVTEKESWKQVAGEK